MRLFCLFLSLILFGSFAYSQSSICGKVIEEETGKGFSFVNIKLYKNGVYAASDISDNKGHFSISVDPGTYDMILSYLGYPNLTISRVLVTNGNDTRIETALDSYFGICDGDVIIDYKIPLIKHDNTQSETTITSEQVKRNSSKNIANLATLIAF